MVVVKGMTLYIQLMQGKKEAEGKRGWYVLRRLPILYAPFDAVLQKLGLSVQCPFATWQFYLGNVDAEADRCPMGGRLIG